MNDVTFGIKTFQRPACCARLVDSIRCFYPQARILVADDGRMPKATSEATHYFKLPFDVGLSAGRNYLVERADTEFFLLLDDDFVFTKTTKVERLRELLQARVAHLMGGAIWEPHREAFRANTRIFTWPEPDVLHVKWGAHGVQKQDKWRWTHADMIGNFFLARTIMLLDVPWDPAFKIEHEHLDFFLRLYRAGYGVGHTDNVAVDHCPERTREYRTYRFRNVPANALRVKHGLRELDQEVFGDKRR